MKQKRKKNPIKENQQEKFFYLLMLALINKNPAHISQSLAYAKLGKELCKDCGKSYLSCGCEGSSIIPGGLCEYCKQKYCICTYEIKTFDDLLDGIVKVAKLNLNKQQYKEFIEYNYDELAKIGFRSQRDEDDAYRLLEKLES